MGAHPSARKAAREYLKAGRAAVRMADARAAMAAVLRSTIRERGDAAGLRTAALVGLEEESREHEREAEAVRRECEALDALYPLSDGGRALILHYLAFLTWEEVGEALGITEAGARACSSRALDRLGSMLEARNGVGNDK